MAPAFEERAAMPDIAETSFEDRLSPLPERGMIERERHRYMRLKGHDSLPTVRRWLDPV